jgi:hypothetical protein
VPVWRANLAPCSTSTRRGQTQQRGTASQRSWTAQPHIFLQVDIAENPADNVLFALACFSARALVSLLQFSLQRPCWQAIEIEEVACSAAVQAVLGASPYRSELVQKHFTQSLLTKTSNQLVML